MKRALIVGCAANLWADVAAARELGEFDATYCVKDAGIHWPTRFDAWITLHPEAMDAYEAERNAKKLPNGYEIVAPLVGEVSADHKHKGNIARRVSFRWPGMNASAGSGIYGAKVAIEDILASGHEPRVVLAGIPMDAGGGHFLPETRNLKGQVRGEVWKDRESFISGFEKALPYLQGRVRSMSGYTREKLGAPTSEWMVGNG